MGWLEHHLIGGDVWSVWFWLQLEQEELNLLLVQCMFIVHKCKILIQIFGIFHLYSIFGNIRGGDQFKENQTELIASFFAVFYFSINLGSTVSSFVSPIIRTSFGYAVAFAVPGKYIHPFLSHQYFFLQIQILNRTLYKVE